MSILQQLLESSELPAELIEKTQTLFEAAVNEKVGEKLTEATVQIKADHALLLQQEIKVQTNLLTEAAEVEKVALLALVESTLQTAVLDWAGENKVELDGKIKVQLAESMIQATAGVMAEHSVVIPDGSTSLLEEQALRIEQLESTLLETLQESTAAHEQLQTIHRTAALNESTSNLTDTQRERVVALLEGVDSADLEQFKRKVGILVEAVIDPTGAAAAAAKKLNEQAALPDAAALAAAAAKKLNEDAAAAALALGKGDGLLVESQPNAVPVVKVPEVDPAVAGYLANL